jgi:hypothetical protein
MTPRTHAKSHVFDVVAGFLVKLFAALDAGADANDAGGARQALFTRKAALTGQPIHLANDADGALFNPAVTLVVVCVGVDSAGSSGSRPRSQPAAWAGWLSPPAGSWRRRP